MSDSSSDSSSSESEEAVSVNTKVLRSRTVPINETDPSLRALVDTSVWPTKKRGVSFNLGLGEAIKKSIIAVSSTNIPNKMNKEEMLLSADKDRERQIRLSYEEELRRTKKQIEDEFQAALQRGLQEQDEMREALDQARAEIREKNEMLSRSGSKPSKGESSSTHEASAPLLPTYSTDALLRLLKESTTVADHKDEEDASSTEEDAAAPAERQSTSRVRRAFNVVSDSVIAPPPFTGRVNADPESWLELFQRYATHRHLGEEDKKTLFPLLMREAAADWLGTLPQETFNSYASLKEAFKRNYFSPTELSWQVQGSLWRESQRPEERVSDFVMRIRKGARRLSLDTTAICDIIVNGLRPQIRQHVLLQRGAGAAPQLEELVKFARLAEAVAVPTPDNTSNLLVEVMKAAAATNSEQAKELKGLANKVAALTLAQEDREVNAIQGPEQRGYGTPPQRVFKATPQRQQRNNWSNNSTGRTAEGGAREFRQQPTAQPQPVDNNNNDSCSRCGLIHAAGTCRAIGATCRNCQKLNHFARTCRAGRRPQQQQPLQQQQQRP